MRRSSKVITGLLSAALLLSACGSPDTASEDKTNNSAVENKVDTASENAGTGYIAANVLAENNKIMSMTEEELEAAFKLEPAASRPININISGSYCSSNIGLAGIMGFYEEEGLEVELIKSQNMMEAMASGKIDLGVTHIAHILKPTSNGLDIAFMGAANTGCQTLYVPIDSPVESLADLKGEIIGVSQGIGGPGHNIVMTMLLADNLQPQDYKFLDFEGSQLIAAAENGEVAGFLAPDQLGEMWVDQGKVKRVRSITFDDDFKDDTCCIWLANGTFREENPVTSYKLSKAIKKMNEYMEANTPETVEMTMDQGWVAGDKDYNIKVALPWNMDPSYADTERTLVKNIEAYKEMGILDKNTDATELMQKHWKPFDLD